MIKATFEALGEVNSPRSIAGKRGKKVGDIIGRRGEPAAETQAAAG